MWPGQNFIEKCRVVSCLESVNNPRLSVLTSYSPASACWPILPLVGCCMQIIRSPSSAQLPSSATRSVLNTEYSKQRDAAGPAQGELCRLGRPGQWFLCSGKRSGLWRGFVMKEEGLEKITKPRLIITIFRRSSFGIDESIIKTFFDSFCNYFHFICWYVSLPSQLKFDFASSIHTFIRESLDCQFIVQRII